VKARAAIDARAIDRFPESGHFKFFSQVNNLGDAS
jgi:hypothetical protein